MINFVLTLEHRYTVGALAGEDLARLVRIIPFDSLIMRRTVPAGCFVFADIERLHPSERRLLCEAYRLLARAGPNVRTMNDPARVKTRYPLLRALAAAGINDFNAYCADAGIHPGRFPVFVRGAGDHSGPLTDLLNDQSALTTSIERLQAKGHPVDNLLVVEFAGKRQENGYFAKFSAMRIADRIVPVHCLADAHWNVKFGMAGRPPDSVMAQEREFIETNPHAAQLARVFEIAGIEYGRADYGVVDGRMQVYEINTNPTIRFYVDREKMPRRAQYMVRQKQLLLDAFAAIDVPVDVDSEVALKSQFLSKARRLAAKHSLGRLPRE
jgi:hypothetical protein